MANQEKYEITSEQYENLSRLWDMFNAHSESIERLCYGEQKTEILYGFQLGKIYSSLRDSHIEMDNLLLKIRKQKQFGGAHQTQRKTNKV